MFTRKRNLIAALLVVGALFGSYQLYAGDGPDGAACGQATQCSDPAECSPGEVCKSSCG